MGWVPWSCYGPDSMTNICGMHRMRTVLQNVGTFDWCVSATNVLQIWTVQQIHTPRWMRYVFRCYGMSELHSRTHLVCGACKVGKLVPQFAEKAPKTPKSKAASRMAPETTQGNSSRSESSAIRSNCNRVTMRFTHAACHISLLACTCQ